MDKIWVLAADRVRARLFEMDKKDRSLIEIRSFANASGREAKGSRGNTKPTRTFESVGMARHAVEPHTTPEEKIAEKFARDLNIVLESGHTQHHYSQLILIAPPRFLGVLRSALGPKLLPLVIKEIEHDLTQKSEQKIKEYLLD